MNQRHPLDELFNQHLRNTSAPVPEDMWNRIAQARQQKRRRLLVAWSSIGSASLVILATAIWMFSGSPKLDSFRFAAPEAVPTVSTAPATLQSPAPAITTPKPNEVTPVAQQGIHNRQALVNASSAPTQVALAVPIKRRRKAAQRSGAVSASSSALKNQQGVVTQATAGVHNFNTDKTEEEGVVADTEPLTEAASTTVEDKPIATSVSGPHQRQSLGVVSVLPEKGFHLAEQQEIKLFANHAPRCADFAGPFFRWDLEMLGGPAYAHQILRAKTSESLPHLQQRQDSESAGVSFSGGLRLAASSKVGLGLRTGLMYTEVNDRFTFNVGSRMDVSVIFGPNGEIIDRDTTYTAGYEDTRRNRLRFVEIPLLIGYERQWGKLRVGVNAGAFLNLYFGAQGAIFSPATAEPIDFGQQGDRDVLPIFERQATAAWYAGVSLAYNLHSRYSIIAEPYFKTYPQALSSSEYDLQQNYWITGMQLGMRMRL